jgi:uncharacterized protein (DUF58 family)
MLKLKPSASGTLTSSYTFSRRGRFRLSGVKVTTTFPFGIFIKGKVEETAEDVIVYPSIKGEERTTFQGRANLKEGAGKARRGAGTELYNLRKYTFSDDSRFIHWRSAARARKLLVKEYEEESENTVIVLFDNRSMPGDEERFEEMVDTAAGVIDRFIDAGCSVGLKTMTEEIPPASGHGQLERLLYILALIEPARGRGDEGGGGPALKVVHL